MIDWPDVARNALWILGLSVVLATWSYARWWGGEHGVRVREALDRPAFAGAFACGMLLFCASLAWGAQHLWERLLWLLLIAAFSWQAALAWRQGRA